MSNYLKGNLNFTNEEKSIVGDFLENHSLTTANKNSIIKNERKIVLEFANKNFEGTTMYFVRDSKKVHWKNNEREFDDSKYAVLKVENGQIQEIGIDKRTLPIDISVNVVFTIEDGRYMANSLATDKLKEKLIDMATEVVSQQEVSLAENRKEGHLYLITEELGNNRFLWDLTDKPKREFEEVSISKELLSKATEGVVLRYANGEYEYYSN